MYNGSTDQTKLDPEELKMKQIADNETKKAQHQEKLKKVEDLHDSTIKWRKALEASLTEHRRYMGHMTQFMTHSIVFMKHTCISDFGMTEEEYEAELASTWQLNAKICQNLVTVDNTLKEAVDVALTETTDMEPVTIDQENPLSQRSDVSKTLGKRTDRSTEAIVVPEVIVLNEN